MRIAVLIEPAADPVPVEALASRPGTRLALLPRADRLAQALGRALRAYGVEPDDVFVVQPAGEGVVDAASWAEGLSRKAASDDDDAVIEARIAEASRALDDGRLDEAYDAFATCDALLSDESGPRRAEVLACLGQIADARGDGDDAIRKLDLALALHPTHRPALEMRRSLARRLGHPATAAAMAKRLLAFAEDDDGRVELLFQAAGDGLHVASDMLAAALRIRPGDPVLLERLGAVHQATGDWARAVDVAVAVAEQSKDLQARAHAFVSAAEMSASRAKNPSRAVALYEAAIADDPEVPGAFEAIEKVLLDGADYAGAERAYARQLERLAGRAGEAALLEKLGSVRESRLGDRRGAVQAYDRLAVLRPDDADVRLRLARLLETTGEDALAIRCLEVVAHAHPHGPDAFRALARIFNRTGDADRAYSACAVLVHLGEADLDEQLTYQQFAPELGVRPAQPIDDSAWSVLLPADLDGATSELFTAISRAAIGMRLEQLRLKKQLPLLDVADRQDVETTTVSAVRTVGWISKLFGLPAPDVYVSAHEIPGGLGILPALEASIALAPSVLSGRSTGELSFLFARELVRLHLTSHILAFYPTLDELRTLVTAAVGVDMRDRTQLPPEVDRTARDLASRLGAVRGAALSAAVRNITERGGQLDLLGWLRAVERGACRAGLLACGDLITAARVLSVDRPAVAGMSAAERLRDLVPFSVSEDYARLRRQLGIAARTSLVDAR
jgi:tetratricopeptide (TPR) repeat protein